MVSSQTIQSVNATRLLKKTEQLVQPPITKQNQIKAAQFVQVVEKWIAENKIFTPSEKKKLKLRVKTIQTTLHEEEQREREEKREGEKEREAKGGELGEVEIEAKSGKGKEKEGTGKEKNRWKDESVATLWRRAAEEEDDNEVDEAQLKLLIQQEKEEQEFLKEELQRLVGEFKEYCGKSSNIISNDMTKIEELEEMIEQNITKVTDAHKETSKRAEGLGLGGGVGGWMGMWAGWIATIKYILFLGLVGVVFILTFFLILYKNKR